MIKWIIVLILLFCTPCCGQDYPPGSYRIEYGGYHRLIARELSRRARRHWRRQINEAFDRGDINPHQWEHHHYWMTAHLIDYQYGPPWYTRAWFHSLEPSRGGAPPNNSILIREGKDFLLLSTPFFSLTNTFSLRFKSLESAIDFKSSRPIIVGEDAPEPRTGWKFKISPEVSISAARILDEPHRVVRRVGIRIRATHSVRNKKIVGLWGRCWWNPTNNELFIFFQLSLLQW